MGSIDTIVFGLADEAPEMEGDVRATAGRGGDEARVPSEAVEAGDEVVAKVCAEGVRAALGALARVCHPASMRGALGALVLVVACGGSSAGSQSAAPTQRQVAPAPAPPSARAPQTEEAEAEPAAPEGCREEMRAQIAADGASLRVRCAAVANYEACVDAELSCRGSDAQPPQRNASGRYYFVATDEEGLTANEGLRGAWLFMRTRSQDESFFGGEPTPEWVTQLVERASEGLDDLSYEEEGRARDARARELCRDEALVPEAFRRGARFEVLGSRGWRRARVGACRIVSSGHDAYLALRLNGAPRGALVVRLPSEAESESGEDRMTRPAPMTEPEGEALAHARAEIARLRLAPDAEIEARHLGLLALTGERSLLYLGQPLLEEGSHDECVTAGACATALLLYDPEGETSEALLAPDTAQVSGNWSILGVVRIGDEEGVLLRYDDLGQEEIAIMTVGTGGRVHGQTLHYFMGG